MMRRLPFPMAINTAFEMCQGKMTLKDYGSVRWLESGVGGCVGWLAVLLLFFFLDV